MPAPEQAGRYQTAVLWPNAGQDRYAEPLRGVAEEIQVRWNATDREVVDPEGNRISLEAEVVVIETIALNSVIWLGTLEDWNATGSADQGAPIMEVVSMERVPDIKGRFVLLVAGLRRFRGTLPASA